MASNAWIHAGTSAACGTLQVGGNLAIAQGALPKFRFAASSADAITVGGQLTFPTNGVLLASALTAGAHAPARAALFTSAQVISGPETLTGWTVIGVNKARLSYSDDRKTIYFQCPRGTLIQLW